MAHPSKTKGDRAELELARKLGYLTGRDVRRKLGAGRADDTGDIHGLPDVTVEVKNYRDVTAAIRDGLDDLRREQANSGDTFGVCFVRRPGGRWIAVMELDQFATWWREATS